MKKIIMVSVLLAVLLISGCNSFENTSTLKLNVAIGVISLITVLFLILAFYSNILRDEVNNLDEFEQNAKIMQKGRRFKMSENKAPFSLTKVQFGVWTVIISSVYIYLSLCKGDCALGGINQTALVLMGIFAGTAVVSSFMDKGEISDNRPRHQNAPSEGFFMDILSDDNGVSLHRFQNVAWTIIAIVVYLYKAAQITSGCELPELSSTLLALTGISSATYLAMKAKENDPPIQDAVNNNISSPISGAITQNLAGEGATAAMPNAVEELAPAAAITPSADNNPPQ